MANQEQQNQGQQQKQPIQNPQQGGSEKNFANQPGRERQGEQSTQQNTQPGRQDRSQQSGNDRQRQ